MRRCSVMPPTLVTSGWTMSKAPRVSQGRKALAPRQHLAARDGHGAGAAEGAEVIDGVGLERLLEPADVVVGQHLGGAQRPF